MSILNETPKDKVYAECESMGIEKVRSKIKDTSFPKLNHVYANAWLREEEKREIQETRYKEALEIAKQDSETAKKSAETAKWSVVISVISALIALISVITQYSAT